MSEVKHTPGPWFIREDFTPSEHGTIDIYNDNNLWLSSALGTHVGPKTKEEARANAKLIAAAPDLLECLADCIENILVDFPDDDPRKLKYKDARDKATK